MIYPALKSELTNDPAGRGYAGKTNAEAAALLNAAGSGTPLTRDVIPAYEIINATVPSEWTALTSAEKQRYQTLTGAGLVDASNPNVRQAFAAMFAAGTATRAALVALQTVARTRAEELFGHPITEHDVNHARSI